MRWGPKVAILIVYVGWMVMGALGQEERLAEIIREAAFDPAKWRDVCDGFAAVSGSIGSLIIPLDVEMRAARLPHSTSLEGLIERYQKHEWYKRDIRERGLPAVISNGYVLDEDCIDYYSIDRSGYFQDFLRPVGMKWFAGLGFGEGSNLCIVSLQRPGTRNPFMREEIEPLTKFRSEVETTVTLATSLEFKKLSGIADFLEQQNRCVIGLNAGGRATYFSPAAESTIGDAIDVSNGWLQTKLESESSALHRLVASLTYRHRQFSDTRPVRISRNHGKPPIVAYGYRLPEIQFNAFRPAVALLVLIDPEKPQDHSPELFMDYFGFTRAEARLAISMLKGLDLEQHAKDSAISITTARNHLQSLLSKTSTHSKAQLVALLSRVVL